jgi:hypothetical protein
MPGAVRLGAVMVDLMSERSFKFVIDVICLGNKEGDPRHAHCIITLSVEASLNLRGQARVMLRKSMIPLYGVWT